ncbi:ribonuclease HII [Neobacillus sp. MM2021_6]|uniref:ribonuclease HII n=1 Tax=Bacillaceae TaxID=186817 RepID=UPI00140DAD99|nr:MULTISPECIES: ribonuclease HII [Bacillaceae]MBO0959130.1 ribonuclease HII [Neobacillus sp. MM2021_6]NHC16951.1 ribonuclease HII [Bacillus sp. MM2020_4]
MKVETIAEIKRQLENIMTENDPFLLQILQDERKGVQQLLHKWQKKMAEDRRLKEKFNDMNTYEQKWRSQGFELIAGVDEVGRGPLAGPVVAAAVILPKDFFLAGLDDSKKISEKKRQEFAAIIKREALAFGIAMIQANEIDVINIYEATKKAMKAAIASLKPAPDLLLIDAMKLETPYPTESIIKGDAKSVSIAAASVVAKVARDEWMKELAVSYPAYGFQQNMGYGTMEHIQAIKQFGITPYHRKSFAPVKDYLNQ